MSAQCLIADYLAYKIDECRQSIDFLQQSSFLLVNTDKSSGGTLVAQPHQFQWLIRLGILTFDNQFIVVLSLPAIKCNRLVATIVGAVTRSSTQPIGSIQMN